MDEEQTRDDLTPEETEQAAEVGATPEQEHRLAEFDALNTKLDALNTKLDYVLTAIGDVTRLANHGSSQPDWEQFAWWGTWQPMLTC